MKIKKLLSLMLMTEDRFHFDTPKQVKKEELTLMVNQQEERIQLLEAYLENKGLKFDEAHPELPDDVIGIMLQVLDENGHGTCAQIRLYPVVDGIEPLSYNKVNDSIDVILMTTDRAGKLSANLPLYKYTGYINGEITVQKTSNYIVEVSKGSAYSVATAVMKVPAEGEIASTFRLERLLSLKDMGWWAGDLHHHSIFSSPVYGGTDDVSESPEEVRCSMAGAGLTFGALSDHHNILNHKEWLATADDNFLPIPSKEISTSNGHVMSLNCLDDVVYKIPNSENRTEEYLHNEFVRIVDEIKNQGGLAQINHPKDLQKAISLSKAMEPHVMMFDTMEIWNGSLPMHQGTTNQHAFNLWMNLLKEDKFIPATTGSDTHNTHANNYHKALDWFMWLKYHLSQELQSDNMNEEITEWAEEFIAMVEITMKQQELWIESCLGSGCVRTYVHIEGKKRLEIEDVLNGLREGKSFLTNGPVLLVTVEGKSCGETVYLDKSTKNVVIECKVMSQKPLTTLEVLGKNGVLATLELKEKPVNELYNVPVSIRTNKLKSNDWLVCRIFSDHTNMAILNPIFLQYKS